MNKNIKGWWWKCCQCLNLIYFLNVNLSVHLKEFLENSVIIISTIAVVSSLHFNLICYCHLSVLLLSFIASLREGIWGVLGIRAFLCFMSPVKLSVMEREIIHTHPTLCLSQSCFSATLHSCLCLLILMLQYACISFECACTWMH